MQDSEKLPVKVALVLSNMPHYRYGVFKALEEQVEEVTFIAGANIADSNNSGQIVSIPAGTFQREEIVRNRWIGSAVWQRGVGRLLKKVNPDAVIFTGDAAYLSTWFHAAAARLRGRKVYFWTIGWHKPDAGLRRFVRLAFYRLANELLVYGNYGRELGIAAGYPAERITVIYNGFHSLADAKSADLPAGSLPDGSRPVIGAVIRLSQNKGLEEVIKAIAHLRDEHGIDADGLIVGEGPARPELKKLATDLGVRLYLPGAMYSQQDLAKVYQDLTVTVVPKAAGLTVLQSLQAGTPVVTIADPLQQMPEFEAIEDGVTGSLVDEADAESIAGACAEWIERLAGDSAETAAACRQAVRETWSSTGQAARIVGALAPADS